MNPMGRKDKSQHIDDSIRSFPLLLQGSAPLTACCPKDEEPLVMTMEFPGMEFVCAVCGGLYGFLAPIGKESTPELEARLTELRIRYDEARKKVTPD